MIPELDTFETKKPTKDLWAIIAMDSDNDSGYVLEWSVDAINIDLDYNGRYAEDAFTMLYTPKNLKYPCVIKVSIDVGSEQSYEGDYDYWCEASHKETLWEKS